MTLEDKSKKATCTFFSYSAVKKREAFGAIAPMISFDSLERAWQGLVNPHIICTSVEKHNAPLLPGSLSVSISDQRQKLCISYSTFNSHHNIYFNTY